MCKLRTIVADAENNILKDSVIDVGKITFNVIDAPAMCIYIGVNPMGYEQILFKYSNIIEEILSVFSKSNKSDATIGKNSGCIYACQFKQETCLSEMDEIRDMALEKNDNVRYQTNIKNLLNLIQHIYAKTNTLFNKRENENRNTNSTASF